MSDLLDLSLVELRDALVCGDARSVDVTRAYLDRIQADDAVRPYLDVFADRAIEQATGADDGARNGALRGVPVALKDNICLEYGRTTCASRFLEAYESPFNATVAQKLLDAGAVILGKTNLDEFAMGSSNEHSALGDTRNPWDATRAPGGSSGGAAAAVAARLAPAAIGSDTGGSVRQPAAFCGCVGLKPTYGRISRWGLVAFASSLDQIGPITRTVADAALLLEVLSGRDPLDSTSAPYEPVRALDDLDAPVKNLRIGVPKEARGDANDPAVAAALDAMIERLRDAGADVIDIELPRLPYGVAAYYLVATAEASSNLARFDGVRYGRRASLEPDEDLIDLYARSRAEGFGPEVQRRIMLGTYALSSGYYDAYYGKAMKARRVIREDFDHAFSAGVHAVLTPTTPAAAFRIGEKTDDPLAMYLADVYTVTANLAGMPAVSIPAGFADVGGRELPIGMQFVGPLWQDEMLLRVARLGESAWRAAPV